MWQPYNDGKKTTSESMLTLVLEGVQLTLVLEGVQLEVECLKGYVTIKSLGTTVLIDQLTVSLYAISATSIDIKTST